MQTESTLYFLSVINTWPACAFIMVQWTYPLSGDVHGAYLLRCGSLGRYLTGIHRKLWLLCGDTQYKKESMSNLVVTHKDMFHCLELLCFCKNNTGTTGDLGFISLLCVSTSTLSTEAGNQLRHCEPYIIFGKILFSVRKSENK